MVSLPNMLSMLSSIFARENQFQTLWILTHPYLPIFIGQFWAHVKAHLVSCSGTGSRTRARTSSGTSARTLGAFSSSGATHGTFPTGTSASASLPDMLRKGRIRDENVGGMECSNERHGRFGDDSCKKIFRSIVVTIVLLLINNGHVICPICEVTVINTPKTELAQLLFASLLILRHPAALTSSFAASTRFSASSFASCHTPSAGAPHSTTRAAAFLAAKIGLTLVPIRWSHWTSTIITVMICSISHPAVVARIATLLFFLVFWAFFNLQQQIRRSSQLFQGIGDRETTPQQPICKLHPHLNDLWLHGRL